MRISSDAYIAADKLTRYLLVRRTWDDKSAFLAKAGFTLDDPRTLELEIRQLTSENEAIEDGSQVNWWVRTADLCQLS